MVFLRDCLCLQEPKKWTKEEAKEWWFPAAADALKRAGKPLADGQEAPFPRGAVDGKVMLKWPETRFAQELGDPTAGKYLRAGLKQRVQDFNDLRKGVAAVRRGEVPVVQAASSSSAVRCSPQRGAPGHENPEPTRKPEREDALQAEPEPEREPEPEPAEDGPGGEADQPHLGQAQDALPQTEPNILAIDARSLLVRLSAASDAQLARSVEHLYAAVEAAGV